MDTEYLVFERIHNPYYVLMHITRIKISFVYYYYYYLYSRYSSYEGTNFGLIYQFSGMKNSSVAKNNSFFRYSFIAFVFSFNR